MFDLAVELMKSSMVVVFKFVIPYGDSCDEDCYEPIPTN